MSTRVFNVGGTISGSHPHISSFAKLDLPVLDSLVGAYVLGGNASLSQRNRVNNNLPLLTVGSPTISPLFGATLQHANCFDTQLTPSMNRTWIVVYKPQALSGAGAINRAPLLGNQLYVSANIRGDQMFMGDPNALYNQADRNNTTAASVAHSVGSLNTAKWAIAVGTADNVNGIMDSARRQSGTTTWSSPTGALTGRDVYTGRNIRIGGDGTGSPGLYSKDVQIGMVVMHATALTRVQAGQQMDYINTWLIDNFGITDLQA